MKDNGRGVIIGPQGGRTYGKGSVQTVFPIENGGGIRLTTAKYYTPSGRSIQNVGITPDIEVKLPVIKEAKDVKDGEPVHVLVREKDLEHHLKNDTVKEEKKKKEQAAAEEDFSMEVMPKNEKDDIQIQKAMDILKTSEKAEDVFKSIPVAAKKETAEKK